ncbi:tyrosine-type recombinase/integrase [Pseudonocardia oroxyli]|uniref:Site-specific recombinase XerD n=1 Tax=Pseudonocardia oroxyli TaxID=366584 RepID=A0A1G7Z352_PSEOR|nr:tyrosine-type recombinase/integrase [Pseudonocardia oroxyli]SDH03158.1 Site-specific recombinase XerD [Pseudonocardia oroxyli]
MAGKPGTRTKRATGSIEKLPSGALRVRVYAGLDPLTKRRHELIEIVPAGPQAEKEAEAARVRFVHQINERRNPKTNATLDQLLERYLSQFQGSPNTLQLYQTHVKNHITPLLGPVKIGRLDAEVLDSFYAELRRCRAHCPRKRGLIDHRTAREHECDERCRPHRCKPLAATTIRHIHFILSGAFKKAIRWGWIKESPTSWAEPPPAPKPNPKPPNAAQAAQIVTESWKDSDWGAMIWTAMTTGVRRGELCAVKVESVDFTPGRETLWLERAIRREPGWGWGEGDLKTHQQRRIALDDETVAVLKEQVARLQARCEQLGVELRPNAYLFSGAADGSTFTTPDSVTQRYDRMVTRLGIDTTLHKLRHYSATELIAAGVDPRTVAGRLGHGGGGATTLRTYTAWVSEADQRAASVLGAGMPVRPNRREEL